MASIKVSNRFRILDEDYKEDDTPQKPKVYKPTKYTVKEEKKQPEHRIESSNRKRLLCKNIITNKYCKFNESCLYAHSLETQTIDPIRKQAYDIITNPQHNTIVLTDNLALYKSLKVLTKVCQKCVEGVCTGGYNCKYGACKRSLVVCKVDLDYGDCDEECGLIHVTQNNVKPFYTKFNQSYVEVLTSNMVDECNLSIFDPRAYKK